MTTLIVPPVDLKIPTLGDQVAQFIEETCVFGPGSLQDQPAKLDPEKLGIIYRCYEVYPMGHRLAGTRIFDRCAIEIRKGLAKCLYPDTMISMADGTRKRADELCSGDEVLAYNMADEFAPHSGLMPAKVSHVEWQPAAPMVRVTTERGRVLEVTTDHPVLTRGTLWRTGMPKRHRYPSLDPHSRREQWTSAVDLAPGDRVVVGLGWSGSGGMDSEDAWILGAFTGDGSGRGRFCSATPEIIQRISEKFEMTVCAGNHGYDHYARGSADFLRDYGMFDTNSRTKRVPDAVMMAKPDAVLAFLAGYLDTDGWVSYTPKPNGKTGIEIAIGSVNRPLLEDCQHLFASLGFNASLVKSTGTYKGQPHLSWNLAIRDQVQVKELAAQLVPHMVNPHKLAKLNKIIGHTGRRPFAHRDTDKVVAVERIPDAETVAVEVADIHTHVTSGIVTHNTEFAAWIAFAELHPESPVRFNGFYPDGTLRQGKPVMSPYIPMMAAAEEQVMELAFGVLKYIVEHSPDSDLFDSSLERIVRLGSNGGNDGMVVPVSNAPATRDGARTTFQHFDEPHRLVLPNAKHAHETMIQNLPKRQIETPWALYTSTAGQPGQNSIEEDVRSEAEAIAEGKAPNSSLFFFSRWAGAEHDDLTTVEKRVEAIADATGPCGEWGLGQFERIARDYERKGVDKSYWERVYLNRWRKSGSSAFDMQKVNALVRQQVIPKGAFCTLGFDGARFRDSTAFVLTDIDTGLQQILGLWERPTELTDDAKWEVDHADVDGVLAQAMDDYEIWRTYCDPPYWVETVADWVARYPERVQEWWTNRPRAMAYSLRSYTEAIDSESITFGGNDVDDLVRHIGHAGRKDLKIRDDEDVPLWVLQKQDGRLQNKFDACMASVLSWEARTDAIREGAKPRQKVGAPRRLY